MEISSKANAMNAIQFPVATESPSSVRNDAETNPSGVVRAASRLEEMSVVHALLQILEEEGVEYIFGVPGGPLTGLFEAVKERSKIRFVLAKHEGGAAFMAAAHARVGRSLAVCCATTGPGATNALTGIASAYADSVPVLILTGQVSTGVFGKGAIQESSVHGIDLVSLFRPVTKLSTMLSNAERAPDILRVAIRTALTGRTGPVHVNMPADLLKRPISYSPLLPEQYRPPCDQVSVVGIERAAQLLSEAARPCILAGHGAVLSDAWESLLHLARTARIPVVTTTKGKSAFPETSPMSLGVIGLGGHERARQYFESGDIDVLLIVGSSMNEWGTRAWSIPIEPSKALIQIDIDPTEIGRNYPVDVGIVGDARSALTLLSTKMSTLKHPSVHDESRLNALKESTPRFSAPEAHASDASPLKPQRLVREMRDAMPDDAMLFVDNGTSIFWGTHYFEIRRPDTFFLDLGLASMGSAVAGVIGGAMAAPDRRAVALCGDAAFAMNGFEVHSAVELGLPVIWVVLNNGGHRMVYQGDQLMLKKDLGVSLFQSPLDIAGLARGLGAKGVRVETPKQFRSTFDEALRHAGPTVIEAIVDPTEMGPTFARRVQTLADFMAI